MKINDKYHDFIAATFARERFVVLQGGKRAGKTFAILQYIYLDLVNNANHRALIVTDTYARLRDSILSDFDMIARELPNAARIVYSGTPRIDFTNGSEVTFVCADKDARGFTSNKDFIFFNECIMYKEDVVRDVLKAGGENCRVFFDYNPFQKFYVNEHYETATNKLVTCFRDNPFCPAFAREELERQATIGKDAPAGSPERYFYEVEVLGHFADGISGEIFTRANIDRVEAENVPWQYLHNFTLFGDPSALRGADWFPLVLMAEDADGELWVVEADSTNVGSKEERARTIKDMAVRYDNVRIFMETNGLVGIDFFEFAQGSDIPVEGWCSRGKKFDRIVAKYQDITKRTHFVESPKMASFLAQVYEFSEHCEHDDNIDAVASSVALHAFI